MIKPHQKASLRSNLIDRCVLEKRKKKKKEELLEQMFRES